ncbi:MAG: hypothetical protein AABW53_02205 [Nanoarchaeota archaeon]
MRKLERLTQGEFNEFFRVDGTLVESKYIIPVGKIDTIVVKNSAFGVAKALERMVENKSHFIPPLANAYVASEFNGSTQRVHRNEETGVEHMYSVYAMQFYYAMLDS